MKAKFIFGVLWLSGHIVLAQPSNTGAAFEEARQLEAAGKKQEAFIKYLSVPGGENAAANIAKADPAFYITLLTEKTNGIPSPGLKVIEGDLWLALTEKDKALAAYREAAVQLGKTSILKGEHEFEPSGYYLVDSSAGEYRKNPLGRSAFAMRPNLPAETFQFGPGSERDNWLIRRFITLEAWQDARQEFERMRQVHQLLARKWLINIGDFQPDKPTERLVRPAGFNGIGRDFALDYAAFLRQRQETNAAIEVLLLPLRTIVMDVEGDGVWSEKSSEPMPPDYLEVKTRAHINSAFFRNASAGVATKEYVRLVFGEFRMAHQEQRLMEQLKEWVAQGQNSVRRVLARCFILQGKTDEALAVELEHADRAKMDTVQSAYRKGQLYVDYQKPEQALQIYETTLEQLPNLPELKVPPLNISAVRDELLTRLQSLYLAMGKTNQELAASLSILENNAYRRANLELLEQTAQRFQTLNSQTQFYAWAQKRVDSQETNALVQANLYWVLNQMDKCADTLAMARQTNLLNDDHLSLWLAKYRQKDAETYRSFLTTLARANPNDNSIQLALLEIQHQTDGNAALSALESLLNVQDAQRLHELNQTTFREAPLKNHFDIGYRILREYEKSGQLDKLRQLGLRIARCEAPFVADYFNSFFSPGDVAKNANDALALAITHADDPDYQTQLAQALEKSPWTAAKAQLERRRRGLPKNESAPPLLGWANAPKGVQLIASLEDVLSMSRDERYIYAGYPWGIAVLNTNGQPVTRVALGDAAQALAATNGLIWAGSPTGLFRIQRQDWKVNHLPLGAKMDSPVPFNEKTPSFEEHLLDNNVYGLALDGDFLWIGVVINVQRLNTKTLEWESFSHKDLQSELAGRYREILPETEYVWADGQHSGLRRYERSTGAWTAVPNPYPEQPMHLIGVGGGELWASAWLSNGKRNVPCLVNRKTLELTPLVIKGISAREQNFFNNPFVYLGTYQETHVFAVGENFRQHFFRWDQALGQLHKWENVPAEVKERYEEMWNPHVVLENGLRIWGKRATSPSSNQEPEDFSMYFERTQAHGGLFAKSPDGQRLRLSLQPYGDVFYGPRVIKMIPENTTGRNWLCTDGGLAVMDDQDRVIRQFSRGDGLCGNRIKDGVFAGKRGYFACNLGNEGGGLIVYNPTNEEFAAYHASDGLAADNIRQLELLDDNKLRITYGVKYDYSSSANYQLYPPSEFDLRTARFSPPGEVKKLTQTEADAWDSLKPTNPIAMPFLGGFQLSETRQGTKRYLCGTRGMVILTNDIPIDWTPESLSVRFQPSLSQRRLSEAQTRKKQFDSVKELAEALKDPNSDYRAEVLAKLMFTRQYQNDDVAALVRQMLEDSDLRVRCTAFIVAQQCKWNAQMVPLLQKLAKDSDDLLSAEAVIELMKHSIAVEIPYLIRLQEHMNDFRNFPFGAYASASIGIPRMQYYESVASMANAEIFALLMKEPIVKEDYMLGTNVFPDLGASLLRHPDAAPVLLQAQDQMGVGYRRTQFACQVFQHAGRAMLPLLHEALTSTNRIIRSNAARTCGAIGDKSSIPLLLQAMDLESGLSRASIVWALGELRSREALPMILKLYTEISSDSGSGFRAAQAQDESAAQYASLRGIESRIHELEKPVRWDLKIREDRLSRTHIFEAIYKIGPELSQEFYRNLATSITEEDRQEAAIGLAAGTEDKVKTLALLRILLSDKEPRVGLRAAISLLIMGQEDGVPLIKEWQAAPEIWKQEEIKHQLERLKDPKHIHLLKGS